MGPPRAPPGRAIAGDLPAARDACQRALAILEDTLRPAPWRSSHRYVSCTSLPAPSTPPQRAQSEKQLNCVRPWRICRNEAPEPGVAEGPVVDKQDLPGASGVRIRHDGRPRAPIAI